MTRDRGLAAPIVLSFLCVGASNVAAIAADTIFLASFSLGDLSRLIGIAAALRVALAFAYAAASERRDLDQLVIAASALVCIACGLGEASATGLARWAVCLAALTLPSLLPLVAFNATTDGIDARHAKRLLPLVAASATVGAIVLGGVAGPLAKVGGAPALLYASAALAVVALPVFGRARAPSSERGPASIRERSASYGEVVRVPAVRVVVGFALAGSMATAFVDFAFKAAVQARYQGADIAAVLGAFAVVSNAVVLVLQVFVTGRIVAKLGVGRAVLVGPVVLGVTAVGALFSPALIGASLTRLGELVVRYGVGNSLLDVLLVPLSRAVRGRGKVLVKGFASPAGAILAGGALSLFGAAGPSFAVQIGFVLATAGLLFAVVRSAPAAYARALSDALAKDRAQLSVSPEAALVFRSSIRRELEQFIREGKRADAARTMDLMTDKFFGVEDLEAALRASDVETRRAAFDTALRLAAGGADLLAHAPPDADASLETRILRAARERGTLADEARVGLVLSRETSDAESDLWAEAALIACLRARDAIAKGHRARQADLDANLKALRKALRDGSAPRKAAAVRALGVLADRRAERDVTLAMSSTDRLVFREAARAAVLLDAPGAVSALIARLTAGPFAGEAARALALAGPRAVGELVLALPVSRGEGAIAPTAVADSRTISGTVRAARALARIGDAAALSILPRFGEIGHRARMALARAFGDRPHALSDDERALVLTGVRVVHDYAEQLLLHPRTGSDLLSQEVTRRANDSVSALFDLMHSLAPTIAIERARVSLRSAERRANALELVETVLPAPLGPEVSSLIGRVVGGDRAAGQGGAAPALDGWLDKVSKYCRQELPSTDPMSTVLDRVVLLKEVGLFGALSGEELYPVAEISSVETRDAGAEIVKQGDPSDALYVVVTGSLEVVKDGQPQATLGPKQTFGELGVLDAEPRAATVVARTSCELLRVPREELEALLDESPELSKAIIRTLLGYVRNQAKSDRASHAG